MDIRIVGQLSNPCISVPGSNMGIGDRRTVIGSSMGIGDRRTVIGRPISEDPNIIVWHLGWRLGWHTEQGRNVLGHRMDLTGISNCCLTTPDRRVSNSILKPYMTAWIQIMTIN